MIAPAGLLSDFCSEVEQFFSEDGPLSKDKKFEFRPQQQQMAMVIARTLEENKSLLVEAGTGVGKSLAYLVPSILFAKAHKRKAVISTHTINLQEQLMDKDIPLLKKILPDFQAVLLKGRQNYLCGKRLNKARAMAESLFVTAEQAELQWIYEWSLKTKDGTLFDLSREPDPKVWSQVCSERGICSPRECTPESCSYQRARLAMQAADVVVINHHLLFLNLTATTQEEGFLFGNDFLIFDEAHTLENVASRTIGAGLSSSSFRYMIHRLYNPKTQKGLLTSLRDPAGIKLVSDVLEAGDTFFGTVEEQCKFNKSSEFRVRKPGLVNDVLTTRLARLQARIKELFDTMDDRQTAEELREISRRLIKSIETVQLFLNQSQEDYVYWVEKTGKQQQTLEVNAAPVDLAGHLREMLFMKGAPVIMTSATLAVNNSLQYFSSRIGADDASKVQVGSPFDFEKQMKLFVPKEMPDPKDEVKYIPALCHWIKHFVKKTHGKAFVLFTSYRTMQQCAQDTRSFFEDQSLELLVQGEGLSRHNLLQAFKEDTNSVLFGTDSFWTGVDVPGEALSNVIITRLPFAVPDTPVIEARLEMIEQHGGNSFSDYSLPEAILKLRQGVGRLIRCHTDSGIIVILDNRILNKPYGRAFLKSLPECPMEIV
ncbi:MAG: helicase C-terminal domain-containing protein [Verrucomicrobiota bacterium]|nr:helicase C-terminal domain-containing protein [Verrucomicrobiota bacterium]